MSRSPRLLLPLALIALALGSSACGAAEGAPCDADALDVETGECVSEDGVVDDMDLFAASGKTDTGYVSDQAAELNSELSGKVLVPSSAPNYASLQAAARNRDSAPFGTFVTEQVKYARNLLKAAKFSVNLESAPATITAFEAGANGITLTYKVAVESLVKNKDLPSGTSISDLIGRTVSLKLPLDPSRAFTSGGVRCATDPDEPTAPDATVQTEINAQNYFFYWNPAKSGCSVPTSTVTFKVASTGGSANTYPEFDKLLSDKRVSFVMLFGQIEHGELLPRAESDEEWDWGWIGYSETQEWLEKKGFTKTGTTPSRATLLKQARTTWRKVYVANKMTVEVTLVSPLELQDRADAARKDAIIAEALKNNEMVYYNGHSFYGSLKALDNPANYRAGYQLIFMDSCWSYAYYTKQVFSNKKGSSDPTGMITADVLNNTEPGIAGNHQTFFVFMDKFFTAAGHVAKGKPSSARNYHWRNLVKYMNTHAKKRSEDSKKDPDTKMHHEPEVYGVSGVATNSWKP
jgi:hypothetical protein